MSLLEKIVFVADYIEPGRKPLSHIDEVRRLAFADIDKAVLQILEDTLTYLGEGSKAVDPMTSKTLEYYKKALDK